MKRAFTREQRATMIYGILSLLLVTVVLQLWLLTATMNAYLGGDESVIVPAALVSLCCFGLNAILLRQLYIVDRSGE
jgi:hypothetical protein